jgi:hypothetical protein
MLLFNSVGAVDYCRYPRYGLPIDPVALNYLKLFPAPNTGAVGQLSNNFTISPNKPQFGSTYDARVDHKLNDRNTLFARFAYNTVIARGASASDTRRSAPIGYRSVTICFGRSPLYRPQFS